MPRLSAPPEWELTDERGKAVNFGSAGYTLFFGKTYQLRVLADFLDVLAPDLHLHVTSRPACVEVSSGPTELVQHGRTYRCVCLRVRRQSSLLDVGRWAFEFHNGEIEVECSSQAADATARIICPVVARTHWMRWSFISLLVGAVIGIAWDTLARFLLEGRPILPIDNVGLAWRILLVAALCGISAEVFTHLALWWRANELTARYRRKFELDTPKPGSSEIPQSRQPR